MDDPYVRPADLEPYGEAAENARVAALLALVWWDRSKRVTIDRIVSEELDRDRIRSVDRGLFQELAYGAIRHRNTLRFLSEHVTHRPLKRYSRELRSALSLGIYSAVYLRTPAHATVNETVNAWQESGFDDKEPHGTGFLNATLRVACGALTGLDGENGFENERDTIWTPRGWVRIAGLELPAVDVNLPQAWGLKYSHPPEVVRLWRQRYDLETIRGLLRWNNQTPAIHLVHRGRSTEADRWRRKLQIAGVEGEATEDPQVFRFRRTGRIDRIPGYREGEFWVQDRGIPGYRARIRPIVSRITIHWPSFYNVVTGKTLALPNLIALQHIPLSPAGVIAKRPAPIALPNSCAAEWRMAPDAVFSPYASVRYFTPHMVHSQYNLL